MTSTKLLLQATILSRLVGVLVSILFIFQIPFFKNLYAAGAAFGFTFIYLFFRIWNESVGFLSISITRRLKLTSLGIIGGYGLSLIFCFAGVYCYYGEATKNDWITSIYFSVVTWTTLGYGDIQLVGNLRIVAALEALCGYVFMALLTGGVIAVLTTPQENKNA